MIYLKNLGKFEEFKGFHVIQVDILHDSLIFTLYTVG